MAKYYKKDIHEKEKLHYVTFTLLAKSFSGTSKIMEPDKCTDMDWFEIDKLPSPMFKPTADKLEPDTVKKLIRDSR